MSIKWICDKRCDMDTVNLLLHDTIHSGNWTNGGPLSRKFELFLKNIFKVDHGKSVIVCNNGTSAMHALVSGIELHLEMKMKWVTQAFTFPSSCEGPLCNAEIVDIDDTYGPDISELNYSPDGLIVTNLFGNVTDIQKYLDMAKIVLFDNATVPFTFYKGKNSVNYGTGCIISLHHTKPLGFGECGVIVVDSEYENAIRRICNFGIDNKTGEYKEDILRMGSNYKISDISVAFAMQYIQNYFIRTISHHHKLYDYMKEKISECEGFTLIKSWSDGTPFVSCFAVICKDVFDIDIFIENGVYVRKYYTPIAKRTKSLYLRDRILCFPCHIDMTTKHVDYMISLLKSI